MADRDVGRMGETEFEQWCSQVPGMVCNRAVVDAGAWDYLVQLPLSTTLVPPAESLDRLPTPAVCWVQVKSRDKEQNTPEIKLSNWRRMINPSQTFFVLVLTFENQNHPIKGHLVPVGEELIAKVLKRLRGLDESAAGELHQSGMVVPVKDEYQLRNTDGQSLKEAIEKHVGPDPHAYYEKKKHWHDTVGFDLLRHHLTIRPTPETGRRVEEQLVDFALGFSSEFPATLTRHEETRFGITMPAGDVPRKVTVTISKLPSMPASVEIVRGVGGLERVVLQCDFYNPRNIFPFLHPDRVRFRFASRFVDLVLEAHESRASFNLNLPELDERVLLSELVPVLQLAEWLIGPDAEALRIQARIGGMAFESSMTVTGQLLNCDRVTRALIRAGLDAETIRLNLQLGRDFRVSPKELLVRGPLLADTAAVLSTNLADVRVQSIVNADAPEGLRVGIPIVLGAVFGPTFVVAGIAYFGTPKFAPPQEGRKRLELDHLKRELVFVDVVEMDLGVTYPVDPYIERVTRWLVDGGFEVIPPDREVPVGSALALPRIGRTFR